MWIAASKKSTYYVVEKNVKANPPLSVLPFSFFSLCFYCAIRFTQCFPILLLQQRLRLHFIPRTVGLRVNKYVK